MKILFLGANGIDTSRLRLGAELRDIQAEIQRAQASREIEVRAELAVTPIDLNRLLLEYEPDVVHFSGHGTALRVEVPVGPSATREFNPAHESLPSEPSRASAILLETHDGYAMPVSVEALARLFGILKTQRCVVLNACFSATQAAALAAHVDCVIGMKRAIEDKSALVFSVGFYQAIARGQTVKAAFDLGCSLITTCGLADADVPELRGRVDPEVVRLVSTALATRCSNTFQVSDVQVIPNRRDRTCTLDFRIWNGGNTDVLINRVRLLVMEVESIETRGGFELSKEYDLDIGALEKAGDVIDCNVSQLVPAQKVDRFGIRVNAKLAMGEYRWWRLQTSLMTNIGTFEGLAVEFRLPAETDEEYAQHKKRDVRFIAWQKAVPDCLTPYSDAMWYKNIDLNIIREELQRAYPDQTTRILILFEWFGAVDGKWSESYFNEFFPELLLRTFPTTILIESLSNRTLTSAQIEGAARYFAGGHLGKKKLADPSILTSDLKELLIEHSLAAGYDEDQRLAIESAIGRPIHRSPPKHTEDVVPSNPPPPLRVKLAEPVTAPALQKRTSGDGHELAGDLFWLLLGVGLTIVAGLLLVLLMAG